MILEDTLKGVTMPATNQSNFIKLLDKLKRSGLTQRKIAETLGVCEQYLSDVKCGQKPLAAKFAFKVAEAFDLDPRDLYRTKG
jgi:transcriptional regulator with XRE-family HTH domain